LGWGVVCFLCGQLAFIVAKENWQPGLRDPEWAAKLARLQALRGPDGKALVLMVGSSRTLFGFQPALLDGKKAPDHRTVAAFNFGLAGAGPLREWLCLRHLLAQGVRPSLLLVEVMPILLNEPGPGRQCEQNWIYVSGLGGVDALRLRRYYSKPSRLVHTWLRCQLLPWYSHRQRILYTLAQSWLPLNGRMALLSRMDPLGWIPATLEATPATVRQANTTNIGRLYIPALQDYRVGVQPARALADLLERCRRANIPAALVLMPETNALRSWYTPQARAQLIGLLTALQREYHVGLLDARAWVADEGFTDPQHLTAAGAAAFSARFSDEVLRWWHRTAHGKGST
jgi:hypothetical protein